MRSSNHIHIMPIFPYETTLNKNPIFLRYVRELVLPAGSKETKNVVQRSKAEIFIVKLHVQTGSNITKHHLKQSRLKKKTAENVLANQFQTPNTE